MIDIDNIMHPDRERLRVERNRHEAGLAAFDAAQARVDEEIAKAQAMTPEGFELDRRIEAFEAKSRELEAEAVAEGDGAQDPPRTTEGILRLAGQLAAAVGETRDRGEERSVDRCPWPATDFQAIAADGARSRAFDLIDAELQDREEAALWEERHGGESDRDAMGSRIGGTFAPQTIPRR